MKLGVWGNSPKGWGWNGIDWEAKVSKCESFFVSIGVLTFCFADLSFLGADTGRCWHWVGMIIIDQKSWMMTNSSWGAFRRDTGTHVRYIVHELSNWKMDQLKMYFDPKLRDFHGESSGSLRGSTQNGLA